MNQDDTIRMLDEVLAEVNLHGATASKSDRYWHANERILKLPSDDHYAVTLQAPDPDDVDSLAQGLQARGNTGYMDAEETAANLQLLTVALDVQKAFNSRIADEVAKARAKVEREEQERKDRQERVAAEQAERKERLLTEFLEEEGRIRIRYRKRWRPVRVSTEERYVLNDDGERVPEHQPVFYYKNERHGYREHMGTHVMAFELKVGSRYQNVWNDGQEDLPMYDRTDQRSPKYDAERSM